MARIPGNGDRMMDRTRKGTNPMNATSPVIRIVTAVPVAEWLRGSR
jgi:hypothetical protein